MNFNNVLKYINLKQPKDYFNTINIKIINELFYFFFHTTSSKSSVYFTCRVPVNFELATFQMLKSTSGLWPLDEIAQV